MNTPQERRLLETLSRIADALETIAENQPDKEFLAALQGVSSESTNGA